jgi:ATP-dependent DNA helicase HFM1/MER3
VSDLVSSIEWIQETFFYIRAKQNPGHYNLKVPKSDADLRHNLRTLVLESANKLAEQGMVTMNDDGLCFQSSFAGGVMCRHYLKFETMKHLMAVSQEVRDDDELLEEMLMAVSHAEELQRLVVP